MPHQNYFEIKADSHRELGAKLGSLFGDVLKETINRKKQIVDWEKAGEQARQYLELTKKTFPEYIEELEGYAEAAGADFNDLWTLSLEDEINCEEKCTTVITNDGKLIAHNEDWEPSYASNICVLAGRPVPSPGQCHPVLPTADRCRHRPSDTGVDREKGQRGLG